MNSFSEQKGYPKGQPFPTVNHNIVAQGSEKVHHLLTQYVNRQKLICLFTSGVTHCRPDYFCHFPNPRHACIMYFESGRGTLSVADRKYEIGGGTLILMREGYEWKYATDPDDPWVLRWVNLENELALQMLTYYALPPISLFNDRDLVFTLQKMQDEICDTTHAFVEKRDRLFQYLLHLVQNFQVLLSDRKNNTPAAKDAEIIADYINTHIMENLRVGDLVNLVFRSSFSASDVFKAKYGCSIKEYILNAKCEVAARMLRENNCSVSEIATALSFCDSQHFSQIFRHRYGVTPTAFRRLGLAETDNNSSSE